jgi:RimJ/RimL family protein N-acetyltransferase
MPSDQELMRIHADTLFTHDGRGRMVGVNEPGGARAPRFFVGRTAQGSVRRFRDDLDDELVRRLEQACAAEPEGDELLDAPHGVAPYEELLARLAPVGKTWAGPAFHFPGEPAASPEAVRVTAENAALLRPHLEPWMEDVAHRRPMFAFVVGSRAVSLCASVRTGPVAHEAGVETAPEFRGRGYAAAAVAAWAAAVRGMGRLPLYSTSWRNTASRALARKLGLRRYGADLHLT